MKWFLLQVIMLCLCVSCAQKKQPVFEGTDFQKALNAEFKDASKSPLTAKDLKKFERLDFFEFNEVFVINGKIELTPNSEYFEMTTSTDRKPLYRIYGIVSFQLKGKTHRLNIYQNKELLTSKGYEGYLFLPFIDETNGETTYGGGRYIELNSSEIEKKYTIKIDFNRAFNPYCAYNYKYSCPIVPIENSLDLKIEAGVKAFTK